MTCIVGLRTKNKVYIGGDRQGSSGHYKGMRKKPKVFLKKFHREINIHHDEDVVVKEEKMGFGYTTSFRMGDILEHVFEIPKLLKDMDEEAYLVKEFVPALIECFKNNHWLEKVNEIPSGGQFIIAFTGRMFSVESDFQVSEKIDEYTSIGCGSDLAKGALFALSEGVNNDMEPESKIEIALKASMHHSSWVGGDFDIINI